MNLTRITTKLRIEPGISPEQSGVFIINYVLDRLAPKYRFGSHTIEDMKQYGWEFAAALFEGSGYDGAKPLENYYYVHARRRFLNLQRDKFFRNQPPCLKCPLYNKMLPSLCEGFSERLDCDKFRAWDNSASDRKALAGDHKYIDFDQVDYRTEDPVAGAVQNELFARVESQLPPHLLPIYNKLKGGGDVSEEDRRAVLEFVTEVLYGEG